MSSAATTKPVCKGAIIVQKNMFRGYHISQIPLENIRGNLLYGNVLHMVTPTLIDNILMKRKANTAMAVLMITNDRGV